MTNLALPPFAAQQATDTECPGAMVLQFQAPSVRRNEPLAPELPQGGGRRVVGARVDGLTVAAVIDLDPRQLDAWRYCGTVELPDDGAAEVGKAGVVRVYLDGWGAELRHVDLAVRPLRGDRYKLENADLRGMLDEHPLAGAHLEVTFSAEFLATNSLACAVAYVRAIGARVGLVRELRTRRVDLSCDVAGWTFEEGDRARFVKRARSKLASFGEVQSEASGIKEHGAAKVTGYTIGAGGALACRVYDKRLELAEKSPHKLAMEEAIWRAAGWSGDSGVTRVEFQLRSEALRTFSLVDPADLEDRLDGLWQYLTREWLYMVALDRSRRERCSVDPRWLLLQRLTFKHRSEPAARRFDRRGARVQQAMGTMLSFIASQGAAEGGTFIFLPPNCGEDEARAALQTVVERWLQAGAKAAAEVLTAHLGSARAALDWVNGRASVALARADSVGGGAVPPDATTPKPLQKIQAA